MDAQVAQVLSLRDFRWVFLDFDGVIKESVEAKSAAFVYLFERFGDDVSKRVRSHHEANGGMSRFEKIPMYLGWAGEKATRKRVDEYCRRFGELARQAVIQSPWVPGAEVLLHENPYGHTFVLITATPQREIEDILSELDLRQCFFEIHGSPTTKAFGVRSVLEGQRLSRSSCLIVGDSQSDLDAAEENDVPFLLRRHATNGALFERYTGRWISDFGDL